MASIPVTWSWGETRTITGFDPAADLFELDWFNGADLDLTEEDGNAVLRIPGMLQSYTLVGVPLSALSIDNFSWKHDSAGAVLAEALAAADDGSDAGAGEVVHDEGVASHDGRRVAGVDDPRAMGRVLAAGRAAHGRVVDVLPRVWFS